MINKTLLAIITLAIFIIGLPCVASATLVEYPQEYKDISVKLEVLSPDKTTNFPITWGGMTYWDIGSYYELRRQTILLERQNELLAQIADALEKQNCKENTTISPKETTPTRWYCKSMTISGCQEWTLNPVE